MIVSSGMDVVKCVVNGVLVDVEKYRLEPFTTHEDNENETIDTKGWKLDGVVVQCDVHMTLKKAATFSEATAAAL